MNDPSRPPTASIIILTRHEPQRFGRCLAALERLPDSVSREILILLNGADADMRAVVDTPRGRAKVLESPINLGFAGGCNMVAAAAEGRYLAFLNDDTEVEAGWLESLVETADADPRVGAVGSCLLFLDGSVQEAGSIIWRDGSTTGLNRGTPPDSPSVLFRRQVDYCSGCSLLVRREAWDAVGGFCEEYFPAYYEDVDLCLSFRTRGYRVIYEPRSRVRHLEGGSSEPGKRRRLSQRHRRRFRQRWGTTLQDFEPPDPASPAAVQRATLRAAGCPRRLLVVDERLEDAVGPSFDRTLDALVELSRAGYVASVWPLSRVTAIVRELGRHGIEMIPGSLSAHLQEPGVLYDTVVIARPHDFEQHEALIRREQPHSVVVYDADAVHHRRLERHANRLAGSPQAAGLAAQAMAMRELECTVRARSDCVTCLSPTEVTFFRSTDGVAPVRLIPLGPRDAIFTTRTREERVGISSWVDALDQAQFSRTE